MKKFNKTKLIRAAAVAGILLALGLSVSLNQKYESPDLLPKEESGIDLESSAFCEEENKEENVEESVEESREETAAFVCVYVCGEVAAPGIYYLPEGARIFDAVKAAGGTLPEAAEDILNLAQTAEDGMKIRIPSEAEVKAAGGAGEAPDLQGIAETSGLYVSGSDPKGNGGSSGKVNLNTASKEELMTLPGIGESRAEKIIAWRTEHGGFQSAKDIMKVSGIKEKAYEKLKDRITV